MGWIVRDFRCTKCDHEWDDIVKREVTKAPRCPACESNKTSVALSAPALGKFAMADTTTRAEILKKRSAEHTAKLMKKEPERAHPQRRRRA